MVIISKNQESKVADGSIILGTVKLAHFSVKEYLVSDRIKKGAAAYFLINYHLSQSIIAQTCLAYLLIFNKSDSIRAPVAMPGPFPLHFYAAQYLSFHLQSAKNDPSLALQKLLQKFFTSTPSFALVKWIQMYRPDEPLAVKEDIWLRTPIKEVAQPLYYASLLGLKQVVERLLEEGAEPDQMGGYHLHAASYQNEREIAQLLVKQDAGAKCRAGIYGTALGAAGQAGHTETVKLLLEHGADVNAAPSHRRTALWITAEGGHTDIVRLLIEHGADVNVAAVTRGTALIAAVAGGHNATVQLLLERGADANLVKGRYATHPLLLAAEGGHNEILKLLLDRGCHINLNARSGGTALHVAARKGHSETVKLLLGRGADVNLVASYGGTALQAAAKEGHSETVKLLLDHGGNVDVASAWEGTALQSAAHAGHLETVRLLLEQGADINLESRFGTALQWARQSHADTRKVQHLLLQHGAL